MPEVPALKVTGERVSTSEGGFNPTWQRHVAAYELAAPLIPGSRMLDVGCGTGHGWLSFRGRRVTGLDIDGGALDELRGRAVCGEMRTLPFADQSFDAVICVHAIEHIPDPSLALAEVARVLDRNGTAVFVTPNRLTFGRPDEIIDPYHFIEFAVDEMKVLCSRYFPTVELRGVFGSERYMRIFDAERRELTRLLRLDPLHIRRLVPRSMRQLLYDRLLRRARRAPDPAAAAIAVKDFDLKTDGLERSLDLLAICRLGS